MYYEGGSAMEIFHGIEKVKQPSNVYINSPEQLLEEIEKVKKEWNIALERFHEVSEPEAVDFMIYYILAAERRYMYLLNKYKHLQKEKKIIRDAVIEVIKVKEGKD